MAQRKFILASASPRRKQLLESVGIIINQIISPDIDETPKRAEKPRDYAIRIAEEKLAAALGKIVGSDAATILAADTVVVCGGRILPKAEDAATARACLQILSGRRHRVITAVAIFNGHTKTLHEETSVKFKRLSPKEIENYVQSKEWEGKAGGYAIQGAAQAFIPCIQGSVSNVIGLPLSRVIPLLTT